MALARSRRLGIADLLGLNKTKRKKGEHFPSADSLGAMTDSRSGVFFLWINADSPGETFPRFVCRVKPSPGSAIYRAISKLFDIGLAGISVGH
jgi:hypothetical protein